MCPSGNEGWSGLPPAGADIVLRTSADQGRVLAIAVEEALPLWAGRAGGVIAPST